MRFHKLAFVMALLTLPASGLAQSDQPEIRQFDIPTLESLGQQIYAQDVEAAKAGDILFSKKDRASLADEKVRGWIVDPDLVHDHVRYVREGASGLEAAYDITFTLGSTPRLSVPEDRTLTPAEKAQFAARILALNNVNRPCSQHYNTVALKDPEGDGWLVWALAATTVPKTWYIGGNYKFTIASDGGTILRKDALSRSCLTMTPGPAPAGATLAAQFSTQLVSNIPVETAVFVNLQSQLPMIVLTADRTEWAIEQGKIRKLGMLPDKSASKPP